MTASTEAYDAGRAGLPYPRATSRYWARGAVTAAVLERRDVQSENARTLRSDVDSVLAALDLITGDEATDRHLLVVALHYLDRAVTHAEENVKSARALLAQLDRDRDTRAEAQVESVAVDGQEASQVVPDGDVSVEDADQLSRDLTTDLDPSSGVVDSTHKLAPSSLAGTGEAK